MILANKSRKNKVYKYPLPIIYMPLAVTHVLLAIIIVDLYRDYISKHSKLFTMHTLFIAGVAALLPDIDIPLSWLGIMGHGGITHTPLFGLIFLIPAFIFLKQKKNKTAMTFFVITFGVLFHIFLDFLLGGGAYEGIMLFWPLTSTAFKIHLFTIIGVNQLPAAVDAMILLLWLWHEEKKHKITDFF